MATTQSQADRVKAGEAPKATVDRRSEADRVKAGEAPRTAAEKPKSQMRDRRAEKREAIKQKANEDAAKAITQTSAFKDAIALAGANAQSQDKPKEAEVTVSQQAVPPESASNNGTPARPRGPVSARTYYVVVNGVLMEQRFVVEGAPKEVEE